MGPARQAKLLTALLILSFMLVGVASPALAGEADIVLPNLSNVSFQVFGSALNGINIMYFGLIVCILGLFFGLIQSKSLLERWRG